MTIMNRQRIERSVGGLARVLGIGLLVGGLAVAVPAAGDPAQGPPRGGRTGPGGGLLGPAVMNVPGLTDAQREQIRAVMEQHRDELRRLNEQVRAARQALQASTAQGQVDQNQANDLGASVSALALAQARVRSEVVALLTPEQRQQIEARREQMREWRESRPDGARRGPGGGARR
jgi:Spy/CpxP family protein refolding chaperone